MLDRGSQDSSVRDQVSGPDAAPFIDCDSVTAPHGLETRPGIEIDRDLSPFNDPEREAPSRGASEANQVKRSPQKEAGAWLRQLRLSRGLSQRQLAEQVGAEYYTLISQLEAGWGSIPLNECEVWSKALNVQPREFIIQIIRYYQPNVFRTLFGSA